MPIYEYACPDCGKEFEALQKFSDDPIRVCPSCQKENVRKKISASSFVLKGGGWYSDHYGLKSPSASSSSSGDGGGSAGASPGTSAPAAASPSPSPTTSSPSTTSSSGS
jgi:putative FmdB family regulatory protein